MSLNWFQDKRLVSSEVMFPETVPVTLLTYNYSFLNVIMQKWQLFELAIKTEFDQH